MPYTCFLLKWNVWVMKQTKEKQTEKKTQHLHCFCCCSSVSVCVRVTCASWSKYINNEWELSFYSLLLSCSHFFSNVWVCMCEWLKTELMQRHLCEKMRRRMKFSNRRHQFFTLVCLKMCVWCECVFKTACSERESKCGCGCGSLSFALLRDSLSVCVRVSSWSLNHTFKKKMTHNSWVSLFTVFILLIFFCFVH